MDCRTARRLLDYAQPLSMELEGSEAEALECHLADCPDCGPLARAERQADEHLGQAMRAVAVPEGLRERLYERLARAPGARTRRRWLRYTALLATAAALLVAAWLGWQNNHPTRFDSERVLMEVLEQINNPLPRTVEDWYARQGIQTVAPRDAQAVAAPEAGDFNYSLLAFYGVEEFQGKRVPMLLFIQGKNQARVYILSEKDFDLKDALASRQEAESGGCRIEVVPNQADPRFAYLIAYTGDLKQFYETGERIPQTLSSVLFPSGAPPVAVSRAG